MFLVSHLAAGQWGLLTSAQAQREGVTRVQLGRLTEAGVLDRVDHGVYAVASAPYEHRALRAAWLALDPARTAEERLVDPLAGGVVSHTSAAGLHRLGDLLDDVPELTLTDRKQTRRGIRLHRGTLTQADVTLVDGLPTTTEERTIADLLRDGHESEHVAQIIGEGLRRGVIDLVDLAARLDPLARRHGRPDGTALVEHLLDLVGLSATAMTRELADTSVGRELVAAGAASAIDQLVAALETTTAAHSVLLSTLRAMRRSDVDDAYGDVRRLVEKAGPAAQPQIDLVWLAEAMEPLQRQLDAVRSTAIGGAPQPVPDTRPQVAVDEESAPARPAGSAL